MPFETFDRPVNHMKSDVLTGTSTASTTESRWGKEASPSTNQGSKREHKAGICLSGGRSVTVSRTRKGIEQQVRHQKGNIPFPLEDTMDNKSLLKSSQKTDSTFGASTRHPRSENALTSLVSRKGPPKKRYKTKKNTTDENVPNTQAGLTPLRIFDGSSRPPLQIRPSTPMMPRRPKKNRISSRQPSFPVFPPAPFLRQTSSTYSAPSVPFRCQTPLTCSAYRYHDLVPPQQCLSSSSRQYIMSEPLLETPRETVALPWQTSALNITTAEGAPPNPFLSRTPLTCSDYKHRTLSPPKLCLTSSSGLRLMSEPLLETPQDAVALPWQTPATNDTNEGGTVTDHVLPSSSGSPHFAANTLPDAVEGLLSMEKACGTTTRVDPPAKALLSRASIDRALRPEGRNTESIAKSPVHRGDSFTPLPRALRVGGGSHAWPIAEGVPSTSLLSAASAADFKEEARLAIPPKKKVLKDLFNNIPLTDKPCRCSSSRCLKLYCECFHYGFFCDERLCKCKNCYNNERRNETRGPREIAIKTILARRPDAFDVKMPKKTGKGCGCKSGCLKKYCECVFLGRFCLGRCTCFGCKNRGKADSC